MKTSRLAVVSAVATWLLLVIGGVVNPTGSSLACPDWVFIPTCHGEVIPARWTTGILIEHGHRLWASVVGLLTVALAVAMWRRPGLRAGTRWLGTIGVVLVAVQGTLGGVTVLLGLNPVVSTLHLLLGNLFFCFLVYLNLRLFAEISPPDAPAAVMERRWVGALFVVVLVQVVLGGTVRHLGAGPSCGFELLSCGTAGLWPSDGAMVMEQRLNMLHRFIGVLLAAGILKVSWTSHRMARAGERHLLARLAVIPAILVVVQVGLGLGTVAGFEFSSLTARVPVVALHTATGGLLLASLLVLYVCSGPLFASVEEAAQ